MAEERKKVFVTRKIPAPGLELLDETFDVTVFGEDRAISRSELLDAVPGRDGILCLLTDTIDGETMDAAPALSGIANYAVGYNNIDIDAATRRGIPVSNTPGVLTDATADLAISLLFACARRIVEADAFVRTGEWTGWGPMQFLGADIAGATLGIVGMGQIGSAVATRAHGLGMVVIYHDSQRNEEIEKLTAARHVALPELFTAADFISLHVPLTEETHHLVGDDEFKTMKQTAILINTSRGPVVDEEALCSALEKNDIAGAGLDVYEGEPRITPGLKELPTVVLLPHIGSATKRTREKMAVMAAENLVAMLTGKPIPNLVNPEYKNSRR
jgi:glyoxylate reductase